MTSRLSTHDYQLNWLLTTWAIQFLRRGQWPLKWCQLPLGSCAQLTFYTWHCSEFLLYKFPASLDLPQFGCFPFTLLCFRLWHGIQSGSLRSKDTPSNPLKGPWRRRGVRGDVSYAEYLNWNATPFSQNLFNNRSAGLNWTIKGQAGEKTAILWDYYDVNL